MFCLRVYTGIVLSSSVFLFNKQFLVLIRTKTVQCIMPTTRHTREPFEEENIFERKKNLHKNWFPFTREKKKHFSFVCVCVCVYTIVSHPAAAVAPFPTLFMTIFWYHRWKTFLGRLVLLNINIILTHTHTRGEKIVHVLSSSSFFFQISFKINEIIVLWPANVFFFVSSFPPLLCWRPLLLLIIINQTLESTCCVCWQSVCAPCFSLI